MMETQNVVPDLPLLRKMASLSHLPQQHSRSSRRSPNTSLSRRSGIMKPSSAQSSPVRNQQRRRAAPMARPVTFHAQQSQQTQPQRYFNNPAWPTQQCADGTFLDGQRPFTWHPTYQDQTPSNSMYSQSNYQPDTMSGAMYPGHGYSYGMTAPHHAGHDNHQQWYQPVSTLPSTGASQQWQHNTTSWFDSPQREGYDGNKIPLDSLDLNRMPASTIRCSKASSNANYSSSIHHQAPQASRSDDLLQHSKRYQDHLANDEEELVGLGLHDKSTNFESTSLLLGAGLDEHEKPPTENSPESKQCVLNAEYSPVDPVPDTIPDDGNDTPITNDYQDFSSPIETIQYPPYGMAPSMGMTDQYQPQPQFYDMSGQSFFFDEGVDFDANQWYSAPQKQLPIQNMGYNQWAWSGPQGGY